MMILGGILSGILEGIGVVALLLIGLSLFIIAMAVKKLFGILGKVASKPFTLVKMPSMNIVLFKKPFFKKKGDK